MLQKRLSKAERATLVQGANRTKEAVRQMGDLTYFVAPDGEVYPTDDASVKSSGVMAKLLRRDRTR